jgi:hypothetical protein
MIRGIIYGRKGEGNMIMALYFAILGGLFYILFLKSPYEQRSAIKVKTVMPKHKVADLTTVIPENKAANLNA